MFEACIELAEAGVDAPVTREGGDVEDNAVSV